MLHLLLHLLLCLSALGLVSEAAPVPASSLDRIDISSCPITYYGVQYNNFELNFNDDADVLIQFYGAYDVVQLPQAAVSTVTYELLDATAIASVAATVEAELSDLVPTASCGIKITIDRPGGATMDVYFLNYGTQAAMHVSGSAFEEEEFTFISRYATFSSVAVTVDGPYQKSMDLTGCRANSLIVTKGTTMSTYPETCTRDICQVTGVTATEFICQPSQICIGNNKCTGPTSCSIVGPSVVDFNNATGAVSDFCAHTVLDSRAGFTVTGFFHGRRLTDTPFLDSLDIATPSGLVHIARGNTVHVDGNDVTSSLSSMATSHVGVDISRDSDGVTVVYIDSSNFTTTIFFDGSLLHVDHLGGTLHGLCGNISADSKVIGQSESGCDVVTVDAAGGNIDCSAVQTRCSDLLATLSSAVDRSAFVTACADNLLCHYPDVDGLACHFLDAYARTSRLSVPREASGCAVPVCVDHYCSWHEFCAVKDSGDAACYCRSRDPDLQNYREMHQYGDVATCSGDSASLTIYTCFLEEAGIDHSELHLNDSSCTGSYDADGHLLTFGFNSSHPCGGTLQQHGDQVVFANRVQNSHNSIVTFKKQFSMDFSCAYTQPSTPSTASFRIHDGSVSLTYNTENFTFTLDMGLFTNAAFSSSSTVTNSAELELNQEVFVRLDAHDIEAETLALVIDDCWTTTESTPTGANRYDLISNKCPAPSEESVTVPSNGEALVSYFKFNVFEYADASTPDIYLHCQVSLCIVANGCVPTCS